MSYFLTSTTPSFCIYISFFKTSSPWPPQSPPNLSSLSAQMVDLLSALLTCPHHSCSEGGRVGQGRNHAIRKKSHNPQGFADLPCLVSESQLSAPPLNVFNCFWSVPLPLPCKASPALHCSISTLCKPSPWLAADSALTPVRRHKSLDMTSLNFPFPAYRSIYLTFSLQSQKDDVSPHPIQISASSCALDPRPAFGFRKSELKTYRVSGWWHGAEAKIQRENVNKRSHGAVRVIPKQQLRGSRCCE